MMGSFDLTIGNLNRIKILAVKAGEAAYGGDYTKAVDKFREEHKLFSCEYVGKLWEIYCCFVLGVLKQGMKERNLILWVYISKALDKQQIDVVVNRKGLQLKFGWPDEQLEITRECLSSSGIEVINAPYPDEVDAIELFKSVLSCAGFTDEQIETEVYENGGFDAAIEVYDWFVSSL